MPITSRFVTVIFSNLDMLYLIRANRTRKLEDCQRAHKAASRPILYPGFRASSNLLWGRYECRLTFVKRPDAVSLWVCRRSESWRGAGGGVKILKRNGIRWQSRRRCYQMKKPVWWEVCAPPASVPDSRPWESLAEWSFACRWANVAVVITDMLRRYCMQGRPLSISLHLSRSLSTFLLPSLIYNWLLPLYQLHLLAVNNEWDTEWGRFFFSAGLIPD